MTRYAEPSQTARQVFFLVALLLAGALLFLDRLEQSPKAIDDINLAIEESIEESFLSAVGITVFYSVLATICILLCHKAIQHRQWPLKSMSVPFRIKITEIRKPWKVWLFCGSLITIYSSHVAIQWFIYFKHQEVMAEVQELINMEPNNSLKQGRPASLAAP